MHIAHETQILLIPSPWLATLGFLEPVLMFGGGLQHFDLTYNLSWRHGFVYNLACLSSLPQESQTVSWKIQNMYAFLKGDKKKSFYFTQVTKV